MASQRSDVVALPSPGADAEDLGGEGAKPRTSISVLYFLSRTLIAATGLSILCG